MTAASNKRNRGGAPLGNLNRVKGNTRFITQALVMKLMEQVTDPRDGATPAEKKMKLRRLDFLVDTMTKMALNGDVAMIKYVIDRIEGTPMQTMQFKPDVTKEEADAANESKVLEVTFERLKEMPTQDVRALYRSKILETHGTDTAH